MRSRSDGRNHTALDTFKPESHCEEEFSNASKKNFPHTIASDRGGFSEFLSIWISVARSKKFKSPIQALKFARNSQITVLNIARKIAKFIAGILPQMGKYCDFYCPETNFSVLSI